MKHISGTQARRAFRFVVVWASAGAVSLVSHAQHPYEILPCDPTEASAKRAEVKALASKKVNMQLASAGVTQVAAQTRLLKNLGGRVLDLTQVKANGVGPLLQRRKPIDDAQLMKVLTNSAAIPLPRPSTVPTPSPFDLTNLHPATANALSAAALLSGITHITRAQSTQVLRLNDRNKSSLNGRLPLSPLAGITAAGGILRRPAELTMLFDGQGLLTGRGDDVRPQRGTDDVLRRLLGGRENCSACSGGQPSEGSGTVIGNIQLGLFKPRLPPVLPDGNDESCGQAFKKLSDVINASQGLHDEYNTPIVSPEQFAKWAQRATYDQLSFRTDLLKDARNYADKCQVSVEPASTLTPHDVTRFVGAIGAPITFGKPVPSLRTCTGTLISSDTVLTARHCFMSSDKHGDPLAMFALDEINQHWFELDSGEPFRYQVCGVVRPNASSLPGYYAPTNDWIEVRIAEPQGARVLAYQPSQAEIHLTDKLLLPGVNVLRHQNVPTPPLTKTEVAGCEVMSVSDGCIFHNCQTLPAMSGAPVFVKPDKANDALQLIGVHLGPRTGSLEQSELSKTSCRNSPNNKEASLSVMHIRNMAVRANWFALSAASK